MARATEQEKNEEYTCVLCDNKYKLIDCALIRKVNKICLCIKCASDWDVCLRWVMGEEDDKDIHD